MHGVLLLVLPLLLRRACAQRTLHRHHLTVTVPHAVLLALACMIGCVPLFMCGTSWSLGLDTTAALVSYAGGWHAFLAWRAECAVTRPSWGCASVSTARDWLCHICAVHCRAAGSITRCELPCLMARCECMQLLPCGCSVLGAAAAATASIWARLAWQR